MVQGQDTNAVSVPLTLQLGIDLDGPEGANIEAMLSAGNYLYVGTDGGGVFRKAAGSSTWQAINTGLVSGKILDLAVDTHGTIYTSTPLGVFKFNGTSWYALPLLGLPGTNQGYIFELAIDPAGNIVALYNPYTNTGPSLYTFQQQGGVSWTPITVNPPPGFILELVGNAEGDIALAFQDQNAIDYVEEWNGSSFGDNLNFPASTSAISISALTVDASNHVYAGYSESGSNEVTIYANGTWSTPVVMTGSSAIRGILPNPGTSGYYLFDNNSDVYYYTGQALTTITPTFQGTYSAAFFPTALSLFNGALYVGANYNGVYIDQDGDWNLDNPGLNASPVYSLLYNEGLYAGKVNPTLQKSPPIPTNVTDVNTGSHWNRAGTGFDLGGSAAALSFTSLEGTPYLSTDAGVYRFQNGSWNVLSGMPTPSPGYANLTADTDTIYALSSGNAVYASFQGTQSFVLITAPPTGIMIGGIYIQPAGAGFLAKCNASQLCGYSGGTSGSWTVDSNLIPGIIQDIYSPAAQEIDVAYIANADSHLHVCQDASLNAPCTDIAAGFSGMTGFVSLYQINNTLYLGAGSPLGPVQIDGLYEMQEGASSFSLINGNIEPLGLSGDANGNLYIATDSGMYLLPGTSLQNPIASSEKVGRIATLMPGWRNW